MPTALAVMAVFLLAAFMQFHAASATSVSLFVVPVAWTLFLGLLFAGAASLCVDVLEQVRKLTALAQQHSFRAMQVTEYKVAGIVSAGSAYAFSGVAILLALDLAQHGLFSQYGAESLFYVAVALSLSGLISMGLFLTGKRAAELENRLHEEARQSWQAMP